MDIQGKWKSDIILIHYSKSSVFTGLHTDEVLHNEVNWSAHDKLSFFNWIEVFLRYSCWKSKSATANQRVEKGKPRVPKLENPRGSIYGLFFVQFRHQTLNMNVTSGIKRMMLCISLSTYLLLEKKFTHNRCCHELLLSTSISLKKLFFFWMYFDVSSNSDGFDILYTWLLCTSVGTIKQGLCSLSALSLWHIKSNLMTAFLWARKKNGKISPHKWWGCE